MQEIQNSLKIDSKIISNRFKFIPNQFEIHSNSIPNSFQINCKFIQFIPNSFQINLKFIPNQMEIRSIFQKSFKIHSK